GVDAGDCIGQVAGPELGDHCRISCRDPDGRADRECGVVGTSRWANQKPLREVRTKRRYGLVVGPRKGHAEHGIGHLCLLRCYEALPKGLIGHEQRRLVAAGATASKPDWWRSPRG